MAAIKADIQAGRLGQRYLLDDEARLTNCYVNDLFIEYAPVDRENSAEYEGDGYSITLQVSAVETLECLREAGYWTRPIYWRPRRNTSRPNGWSAGLRNCSGKRICAWRLRRRSSDRLSRGHPSKKGPRNAVNSIPGAFL